MILNESAKLRKIEEEEEEKAEEIIPLKPRLIKHVFEKGVFRVSNKFKGSDNSRSMLNHIGYVIIKLNKWEIENENYY